jgi:hypothetical protein
MFWVDIAVSCCDSWLLLKENIISRCFLKPLRNVWPARHGKIDTAIKIQRQRPIHFLVGPPFSLGGGSNEVGASAIRTRDAASMSIGLSSAEYAVLGDLATGPCTLSKVRLRDAADRLVAAGYATSRNLNFRAAAYEITALGRIALVLSQYGVLNTRYTVVPHRHDVDGLWYLTINTKGNPALLMSIGTAAQLMDHLRAAGTDHLANDLKRKIEKARRYTGMNTT